MKNGALKASHLRACAVIFLFAWTLFTLYPNPGDLVRSVYRIFRPPVDAVYADAHAHLIEDLSLDGNEAYAIERRVKRAFPYQYDWVTYGVPWYFPTVQEAFAQMAGDCKTQLVVLASLLESRGIDYSISVSPTHVWVQYDGKPINRIENEQVALFSFSADGGLFDEERGAVRLPAQFSLARSFDSFWTAFWHYMPHDRKVSLLMGFVISILLMIAAGVRTPVLRSGVTAKNAARPSAPRPVQV